MSSLKKISASYYVGKFKRHTKMINVIGVDIFDDSDAPFIRKYGRLIIFSVMLLYMFVGQILYVVRREEVDASFLDVVSAIPSILIVIQNVVKLIVMTIKRNEIKQLTLEIGQLWRYNYENNKKNEEMQFWTRRLIIWKYELATASETVYSLISTPLLSEGFFYLLQVSPRLWSHLMIVMFGAMAVAFTFFAGVPLLVTIYSCYTEPKPEYKYIVKMYFFTHVDSHLIYFIAVTYQLMTSSLCQMCIYTPCDYLLLHQSFSLSALLSLVQIDLLCLKSNKNLKDLHFYGDDDCEDIKSIVKTHQMLLSLAERLNAIFKEIIFSQVYFSSVIICCYLFTAVMSKSGVALILGDFMAAVVILVAIFNLAVPGQVIADISSGIAHAAYQSPWFEKSYKFRKCIVIIMVRAQKPFHLSALGFSDLTLAMFSKVVSTTWSYLSLLNQMTENLDV